MGWLFLYSCHSKKDIIEERCRPHVGKHMSETTVAKCLRGNVLWRVAELYHKTTGHTERIIVCDLLGVDNFGYWGYKDMDESMHPYYYSCPVKYLDMGTRVLSKEWRAHVRDYAAQAKVRRAERRAWKRGWI